MSELRYHPFLDQWVITATHRQDRTFHPPADYCPLCPTQEGGFPTEVPFSSYDIAVFENKFPSLSPNPPEPAVTGSDLMPVLSSRGVCEVVLYSQVHDGTLATLPFLQARKLTRVWRDRYLDLASRDYVEYVFIFENKGKEIGVTLAHPHGQIYAYPHIPPMLRIELEAERRHFERTGRPLMQDVLAQEGVGTPEFPSVDPVHALPSAPSVTGELTPQTPSQQEANPENHIVWQNGTFVAFVPFFARYPYEVYVTSKRHIRSLRDMSDADLDDLAEALLVVTRKYDRLFGFSMPYIMSMHQEPAIPGYEFNWFHVEFYPPYRTANKLKYLAGSEAAAGAFINDTLPEDTARTLRDLEVGPVR
jgi:UDPglucose--hexose-1-phosphate uridylyltransferase